MIDPKKIDLNQLPKRFCDGAVGGFNKEIFLIVLTSGTELTPFATSPQVAKSIALWLSKNVQDYESRFGEINMNAHLIQSPFQPDTLSGSDKSDEEKKQ
ncbi:MAG TPA: DUF3467 domain-containing protein [Candidatus Paceibacterota bacterium]|nr:DUF3467 domain-containing protein [Candidatus Paceibacterota bacterium]